MRRGSGLRLSGGPDRVRSCLPRTLSGPLASKPGDRGQSRLLDLRQSGQPHAARPRIFGKALERPLLAEAELDRLICIQPVAAHTQEKRPESGLGLLLGRNDRQAGQHCSARVEDPRVRTLALPRVQRIKRSDRVLNYHRPTGLRLPDLPESHPGFVAACAGVDASRPDHAPDLPPNSLAKVIRSLHASKKESLRCIMSDQPALSSWPHRNQPQQADRQRPAQKAYSSRPGPARS